MKQSDIITVILITMIGTIAAGFVTNAILGNPDDASEKWKTIETVSSDLSTPDSEVFNADAINPTVEVYVGNCEDRDQDGVLSEGELIACGWMSAKEIKGNTSEEDDDESEDEKLTPEEIIRRGTQTTPSGTEDEQAESSTGDGTSVIPGLTPTPATDSNIDSTVPSTTPETQTIDGGTSQDGTNQSGGAAVPGVEL